MPISPTARFQLTVLSPGCGSGGMLTVELPTADLSTCCSSFANCTLIFTSYSLHFLSPSPGYGFGGMLTVELPNLERAKLFMERLQNKHGFGAQL